jgi:hypothetical protein
VTGPEHYEVAQEIVSRYTAANLDAPGVIAVAQVHATLALAAATVLTGDPNGGDLGQWHEAVWS